MSRLGLAVVFLFQFSRIGGIAAAEVFEHPGGLHSQGQIEVARKRVANRKEPWTAAYKALIQEAGKGMARSPEAVADFNVPGYYSDPEGLSRDAWTAYSCAVAYQLASGKERKKRYLVHLFRLGTADRRMPSGGECPRHRPFSLQGRGRRGDRGGP